MCRTIPSTSTLSSHAHSLTTITSGSTHNTHHHHFWQHSQHTPPSLLAALTTHTTTTHIWTCLHHLNIRYRVDRSGQVMVKWVYTFRCNAIESSSLYKRCMYKLPSTPSHPPSLHNTHHQPTHHTQYAPLPKAPHPPDLSHTITPSPGENKPILPSPPTPAPIATFQFH